MLVAAALLVLNAHASAADMAWTATIETQELATIDGDDREAIVLAAKDGATYLGDVRAQLAEDGLQAEPHATDLLRVVTPILKAEILTQLRDAIGSSAYLPVTAYEKAGLPVRFDTATLELRIAPHVSQRIRRRLAGQSRADQIAPDASAEPATISGFVNVKASGGVQRSAGGKQSRLVSAAALEGALRWRGAVLETNADINARGASTLRGTRLVYDMPEDAQRWSAGAIQMTPGGFLSWPALRGISLQKSYQSLQPLRDIRATGQRSFRLERDAEVELQMNGMPFRRVALRAGDYDLDDLPLANGVNALRVVVKGEAASDPETYLDFAIPFNRLLLAPEVTEWAFAVGDAGDGSAVAITVPVAAGLYRRGIRENMTVSLSGELTRGGLALNANALMQTSLGLVSIDTAARMFPDGGMSHAFGTTFELTPALGAAPTLVSLAWVDREWRSLSYNDADQFTLGLARSFDLGAEIHATLSLDAAIDDGAALGSAIALNKRLNSSVSASVFATYQTPLGARDEQDASALMVLGRLHFQLGDYGDLSLTRSHEGRLDMAFAQEMSTPSTQWSLDMRGEPGHDGALHESSARLGVTTAMMEASITHDRAFQRFASGTGPTRTAASAAAGIAFADGQVAIGRPVRGAFAIVQPHPDLAASTLKVNEAKGIGAGAPVLVGNLPAYAPARVLYDFEGLPEDAVTGAGAFHLKPAYRSGHALTAGAGIAASVTGVLTTLMDEPLALISGRLTALDTDVTPIDTFTDENGRFTVEGVSQGRWRFTVASTPLTEYEFEVPPDARGLLDIGTLKPRPGQ